MGTTFGIELQDTARKHEGHETFMKRQMRETLKKPDLVNSPPHYTQGSIQCIDAIEAALGTEGFLAFCRGNIIKYNWRADHKNGSEDLEKARWYAERIVQTIRKGR